MLKDKDNTLENLEKTLKYLERRFYEQHLEVYLEEEQCQKVFQHELWKKDG